MYVATENEEGIKRGVIYTLPQFMQIAGMSRHAMRSARKDGLTVRYRGNRAYVSGDDFYRFMESAATERGRR
ncbi:MAG: hypothetical protein Tsb009_36220 [Planctomycetaceae bacterium]